MVGRVADFSDAERDALRRLTLAVYPPGAADEPAHTKREWRAGDWAARLYAADGTLVSYVGITLREARLDDGPVLVGGIGSVKTHPDARGQGLAARGIEQALAFMREQKSAFALLVCRPPLVPYYAGLGWQRFGGRLLVRQFGAVEHFTFNEVMTHALREPAPRAGTLDLLGPPW